MVDYFSDDSLFSIKRKVYNREEGNKRGIDFGV
jgi:hypothetical protein